MSMRILILLGELFYFLIFFTVDDSCIFCPFILLNNKSIVSLIPIIANANIAITIEPYRKATSFGDWIGRLGFFFMVNNVAEDAKRAHFITLSALIVFAELKLLFPNTVLSSIAYSDMVTELRARFHKTESDLT